MKIGKWFKEKIKKKQVFDSKSSSIEKEITTFLSCPADQPNSECSLVEKLREKQKELKEFNNKYSSTFKGYKDKICSTTLLLQLKTMLNYNPFVRYIIRSERYPNDSYDLNYLIDEIFKYPMSDEEIDSCIDFFTQYKQMIQDIKDAPQKKKNLETEIATLKQQLGIE